MSNTTKYYSGKKYQNTLLVCDDPFVYKIINNKIKEHGILNIALDIYKNDRIFLKKLITSLYFKETEYNRLSAKMQNLIITHKIETIFYIKVLKMHRFYSGDGKTKYKVSGFRRPPTNDLLDDIVGAMLGFEPDEVFNYYIFTYYIYDTKIKNNVWKYTEEISAEYNDEKHNRDQISFYAKDIFYKLLYGEKIFLKSN